MIIVTGLPRAGSMSMSKALEILGYNPLFYCPLTQQGQDFTEIHKEVRDKYDAIIDWSIAGEMSTALSFFKPSKVILLYRDCGWDLSIESFGVNKVGKQAMLNDFRYAVNVLNRGCIPYLMMDIVSNPKWTQLCGFLDKSIPDAPFPHLNKSEIAYNI